MKEITKPKDRPELDEQRREGEARSLLQDLEKLISLGHDKKLRWVWELIQNARDQVSKEKKVNIIFTLTNNKLSFEHDGTPFLLKNLYAIVRKTSTKPLEGIEGNAGKFGTGFVITQVLNKIVTVSGILVNDSGKRPFELTIDRSKENLADLMGELENAYCKIDEIDLMPPVEELNGIMTKYEYTLEPHKFSIAEDGLKELERNLSFTLLINENQIASITIKNQGCIKTFSLDPASKVFDNISFSKLNNSTTQSGNETGLLFNNSVADSIVIAFPAIKNDNGSYTLTKIGNQARLFRSFPLIGTENAHFPCFIHSDSFQPTEQRDGVRTFKDKEEQPDKHADQNRAVLKLYSDKFHEIIKTFSENQINNLHLLAESGIPNDPHNYLGYDWYKSEIQRPVRQAILTLDLVETVNGDKINIAKAKFIKSENPITQSDLYSIASEIYSSSCPNSNSYEDWKEIIEQDEEQWVNGIYVGIEDILKEVESKIKISELKLFKDEPIDLLNKLIDYIHVSGKIELTETYAVYPNENNNFKKRLDLKLNPGFDETLKSIAKNIFQDLSDIFISSEIKDKNGIQPFNKSDYFTNLNTYIGNLPVHEANAEQISSIISLSCHFKNAHAPKRDEWFALIYELLPSAAQEKLRSDQLEDFDFETVDKWCLKYVCFLIQTSQNIATFSIDYFDGNNESLYKWLNKFIAFTFRNEDNKAVAAKFTIIPTQDGIFKEYTEALYRESNQEDFEDLFKDLIKDYLPNGDPRAYLIDQEVINTELRANPADVLTGQIDQVFKEVAIEKDVEEGGHLNPLFHKLNNWFEDVAEDKKEEQIKKGEKLFPIFNGKRPDLSVRAYGKVMRQFVMQKGIEEIKALTELKLNAAELQQLENAAEALGGTAALLNKMQDILEEADRIKRRKEIGKAAEDAFKEAMSEIDTKFDIENPDIGKDFTIISKTTTKEFYVEIKSTVIGMESVKMSSLQGKTANEEQHRYSLSVITRPSGLIIDKEYFINNARFVPTIGQLIGDKVNKMASEIEHLSEFENGDVNVSMDNKTYSVYIGKKIWTEDGISFIEFVKLLKDYLKTNDS